MSRARGLALTLVFAGSGIVTSYYLWTTYGTIVAYQVLATLVIAAVGEHMVSNQGYYYYSERNGVFIGNVPLWIPFMWVFEVQFSLICAMMGGLSGLAAAVGSGVVASLIDFTFLEPVMARMQRYWVWQSVKDGYFSFLPRDLHRFTAPPGNYITWFLFPVMMNMLLVLLSTI